MSGVEISKDAGGGFAMAESGDHRLENAQCGVGATLDVFGPGPDFPEDRLGRKMVRGDRGNGGKSFPMSGLKIGAAEQSEMMDVVQGEIDLGNDFERFLPVILVQGGPGSIGKILARCSKRVAIVARGHAAQPESCTEKYRAAGVP